MRHRGAISVVGSAELLILDEVALRGFDVSPMDLDMAEVVELDAHHPQVAEASIQGQAFFEESGGPIVIAGQASALGVHVERRLPHGRLERTGELARLGCKRASVVVLAVEEGHATEPEVGECQSFRVLDRTSGFQGRFASGAQVFVGPDHEGEQPVPRTARALSPAKALPPGRPAQRPERPGL